MKNAGHEESLKKGTFLLVCSGESYSAKIVKWPGVLDAMMEAMFDTAHAERTDERQRYQDELEEPDSWSHDSDLGPIRWSEAVGETDNIELVLITEANYVLLEQLVAQNGDNKLSGQIAYEAYCNSTGWKSAVSGQPLPQWEQVKWKIKDAWQDAGNALKLVAERTWPDIGPDPLREREKVKPGIKGVLERTCGPCVLQQPQAPDQTGLYWRWDVDQLRTEVIWRTAAMEGGRQSNETFLAWAVGKWNDEVKNRPLVNVHRRTLDDTWRQVIRYAGGDPLKLLGPAHDDLLLAASIPPNPKIVVLCGSSRFVGESAIQAWQFNKQGIATFFMPLLPQWYPGVKEHHQAEEEGVAKNLDDLWLRLIDMADEVFVVNVPIPGHENGYIGERTRIEINHAKLMGKPVNYLTPIEGKV